MADLFPVLRLPPVSTLFPYTTLFRSMSSLCAQTGTWWVGGQMDNARSEEHTSELQSRSEIVCRLLLEKKNKKSFTSISHSTRNKTSDGLIRVRNIRALNGRFNTTITHAYSIVIGSKHITLNATGGGFLTASKQFRHGATSKSRSNTASNSTKHKSPHLSGWRQIISLIT